MRNAGEDVKKREPLDIVGGNVNRYSHYKKTGNPVLVTTWMDLEVIMQNAFSQTNTV